MRTKLFAVGILVVLPVAARPSAADTNIHIPTGRSVSGNWNVTDGAGYAWNIYVSNGYVSSGSHSAYSGGMQLQISGSGFSSSSTGRLSKDGNEIEIGPWRRGSVNVYRRIYVDKKIGYCRWIDIFENTSSSAQTLSLRYHSSMGISTRKTYTTSGGTNVTDKDWGIVTGYTSSSYAAVAHVFATKKSKVRPRFQWNRSSSTVYYHHTLKVPAKKTVALCLIEVQRRPFSAAQQFLKGFKVERELKKIPPALRRIIINMGGAMLTLGSLELPRNEKLDLVVQRGEHEGNELLGTILNDSYAIETLYGKVMLGADRVVGLQVPAGAGDRIRLGLADGQVIVGKLLSSPIKFKLANGNEMTLAVDKIDTAAYRISPSRPEEIAFRKPMVVLRNGQQLFFKQSDADWSFHTEYGEVKLNPGDLRVLILDTPDGGLHRAVFGNNSILSGLLTTENLELTLDLGPKLVIRRYLVHQFAFPVGDYKGPDLAEMQLRNEDVLAGRIADDTLKIDTGVEQVSVGRDDIAQITIPEEAPVGRIRVRLHNGSVVEGRLLGRTISFQITPGLKLPVYVGHIVEVTCPKPPPKPTTQPATKPAAKSPAQPTTARQPKKAKVPTVRKGKFATPQQRIALLRKTLEKMKAELGATTDQKRTAELKQQIAVVQKKITEETQRTEQEVKMKAMEAKMKAVEAEKAEKAKKEEAIRRDIMEKRLRDRSRS